MLLFCHNFDILFLLSKLIHGTFHSFLEYELIFKMNHILKIDCLSGIFNLLNRMN